MRSAAVLALLLCAGQGERARGLGGGGLRAPLPALPALVPPALRSRHPPRSATRPSTPPSGRGEFQHRGQRRRLPPDSGTGPPPGTRRTLGLRPQARGAGPPRAPTPSLSLAPRCIGARAGPRGGRPRSLGEVTALPVNSPLNKGDTEVMKCIVEVISDTLSKPSPMPVSQECFETLRGDERILSILRHQNLLKELQDLALQGAKERAQQQKKHSSFEDELSEVLENQSTQAELKEVMEGASSKEAAEKRGGSDEAEKSSEDTEGARPQALPEPRKESNTEGNGQAPGDEEATNTPPPASPPSQKDPGLQAQGDRAGPSQGLADREKGLSAEHGQQAKRQEEEEEEEEEEAEAGEEPVTPLQVLEGPTTALSPYLGHREVQKDESRQEALAVDAAGKPGAEEPRPLRGKGEQEPSRQQEEEEEEMAGAPRGLFRGWKSGQLEQEQEQEQEQEEDRLSKEWEDAKRWSKMDQLAKELTAEKRLEQEDDDSPDRSMKLSLRARGYGFRGPGPQLRRGWRPSSREDSVEAGLPLQVRGYPEEKKEEEGSANRRPEDQELESLSAIEAELEKVARELQALRRG
ncbi:chromogranin-A [Lemur catta]|uniref:chromogranin-A n=1 Tax=Lemur catta TaxID=9447 RepID=UPI001E268246|nr:chromogranin-A [Lemur catta]